MISSNAIIDVEYLDEGTFLYCEEKIRTYKLKQKGYRSTVLGGSPYTHTHLVSINKKIQSQMKKQKILLESRYIRIDI